MSSSAAVLDNDTIGGACVRFTPVLSDGMAPLKWTLALDTYQPRPGDARSRQQAIALLDTWLSQRDPEDERSWQELRNELPSLGVRFAEPE